jgi:YegS/Rv2252/BmrU family lipid kinase
VSAPVCLIVNPSAGGGKAGRVAPRVERTLREHGLQVRRVDTRDLDHARTLATEGARAGETVVALSGDGMVGVVADALRHVPGAVLGVLPGGRGNDLARVLGIPDDPLAACAVIATGTPRAMDVGELVGQADGERQTAVAGQVFVGIASAGFDSDANRIANQAPAWLGSLVYAYGALRALAFWRPARFEIELDGLGERHTFTGYSVAAANSRAYGGGMHLAPDALLDDGLLEIVVIERVGRLRFLANLPKVFAGSHVRLPSVHVFRAAEVEISADRPFALYADGDPIGNLPVRVRAVRGAVSVLVPAGVTGGSAFSEALPVAPFPVADSSPSTAAGAIGSATGSSEPPAES